LYERQGFAYDFPKLTGPLMEFIRVIEDDGGRIVAAVGFERILQTYFWCDKLAPAEMQRVVEHFHVTLSPDIEKLGYDGVTAFLPPQIDNRLGRWLIRRFGWCKSWQAWGKRFK